MAVDQDYLQRRLDSRVKDGIEAHKISIGNMANQMARRGAFSSGSTISQCVSITGDEMRKWFEGAAQFVFSATDSHDDDVATKLEAATIRLHDLMLKQVQTFMRRTGLPSPLVDSQFALAQIALTNLCRELLDDFRHGISGNETLKKDPVVSLIANQSNSPGAVLQIGAGKFSQSALVQHTGPLIQAIDSTLNSPEFSALPQDQKDAISDIADALKTEAAKISPDEGKLGRWGKRLVEITENVGMQLSSHTIAQVLIRIFGA